MNIDLEQFIKTVTDEEVGRIMANTCMTDMYKYSIARSEHDSRIKRSETA